MESRARFSMITILIIAFALLHSGEAIQCYTCSSEQSSTCANAPASYETTKCLPELGYCMTCNGRNVDGNPFILRSCFGLLSGLVNNMECTVCNNKDLCNGSLSLSISMAALGGLVLLWATRFVLIDF